MKLTKLRIIALSIAQPNPWISKPFTVAEVTHSIKPLITKVKSPRVTILKGRVRIIRIGLIMAFTIPRKMEPTIAPHTVSSKWDPRRAAVRIIASMLSSHLTIQPCIRIPPPHYFLKYIRFYSILTIPNRLSENFQLIFSRDLARVWIINASSLTLWSQNPILKAGWWKNVRDQSPPGSRRK